MEPNWSHDNLFPTIARAISDLYAQQKTIVTHDQIVTYLLQDPETSAHIDAARAGNENEHTREWLAHNMVAWFSQRITVGESDWANQFDRERVNGKWAYTPRP